MPPFAIILFVETNDYGIVPAKWLTLHGTKTYWPPFRNVTKAVVNQHDVGLNWKLLTVECKKYKSM